MKRIAILAQTVCQPTEKIIRYFSEKGYAIDAVIIETSCRQKFSEREIHYRRTHDKFNRKTKKYSFIRRSTKRLWDLMPFSLRCHIQQNIYKLPVLNRFSLHKFCDRNGITAFEVPKHSSEATVHIVTERKIDYLLMVSSGWLLKEPLLSMSDCKIINAHSGWLPKHKGLDSIPWSLMENDPVGLTTHFIDSGIDSGDMLRFYEAKIEHGDNFNDIKQRVSSLQPHAFYDTLLSLENNEVVPQPQDNIYPPHIPMDFELLWELQQKLTGK